MRGIQEQFCNINQYQYAVSLLAWVENVVWQVWPRPHQLVDKLLRLCKNVDWLNNIRGSQQFLGRVRCACWDWSQYFKFGSLAGQPEFWKHHHQLSGFNKTSLACIFFSSVKLWVDPITVGQTEGRIYKNRSIKNGLLSCWRSIFSFFNSWLSIDWHGKHFDDKIA